MEAASRKWHPRLLATAAYRGASAIDFSTQSVPISPNTSVSSWPFSIGGGAINMILGESCHAELVVIAF